MFKVALKLQKVCLFGSQRFDRYFVKKKEYKYFFINLSVWNCHRKKKYTKNNHVK